MTVHFQCVEECTEGTSSLYCSWFSRGIGSLNRHPLSSGNGGGEVRGLISLAVSAGVADSASVEAAKEELSQDVQKPLDRVGQKIFLRVYSTSPGVIGKLKMYNKAYSKEDNS